MTHDSHRRLPALSLGLALLTAASVTAAESSSAIEPRRSLRISSGTMQDPIYVRELAEGSYLDGDLERAVELYLEVAKLEVEPTAKARALVNASWLQFLLGRKGPALAAIHTALRFEPDMEFDTRLFSPEFERVYLKARVMIAREGGSHAPPVEVDRPAATPAGPEEVYHQAVERLDRGDDETALALLQRAASLTYGTQDEPRIDIRRSALLRLGLLYYDRGQWGDAATAFEEAVDLDRTDTSAWKNLGLARKKQGDAPAAIEAFREAYARQPGAIENARNLGRALLYARRWEAAASWIGDAIRHHPRDASLRLLIAEAHLGRGAAVAAATAWQAAMELDNGIGWTRGRQAALQLAVAQLDDGHFDSAAATARTALEHDSGDAAFWNLLGLAQQGKGQAQAAKESFLRACDHDDGRAEYRNNLGRAYAAVGDLPRAEQEFVHALTLEPELPAAQANLAQVRKLLKR